MLPLERSNIMYNITNNLLNTYVTYITYNIINNFRVSYCIDKLSSLGTVQVFSGLNTNSAIFFGRSVA